MYLDTRDKGIVGHLCRGRGWEPAITNGMHAECAAAVVDRGLLGNTIRLHNIAISDRPGTVA